jgi:hypothetical protein
MPYCSRCGVEISHGVKCCILCSTPVQILDMPDVSKTEKPYPDLPVPDKVRNIIAWVMTTTFFFAAAFITIAVDLVSSGHISWSAYPVSGIMIAWSYITILVFFIRKQWIAAAGWVITTVMFLGILSAIDTARDWFFQLGLPLTLLSGAAMALVLIALTHVKSISGLLAMLLGTVAFFCCGVDIIISNFLGNMKIGWSMIVLASILPFEGLMMFYSLYLHKHVDLRRYFHI